MTILTFEGTAFFGADILAGNFWLAIFWIVRPKSVLEDELFEHHFWRNGSQKFLYLHFCQLFLYLHFWPKTGTKFFCRFFLTNLERKIFVWFWWFWCAWRTILMVGFFPRFFEKMTKKHFWIFVILGWFGMVWVGLENNIDVQFFRGNFLDEIEKWSEWCFFVGKMSCFCY